MATDLAQIAKQNGIKYFLISFVQRKSGYRTMTGVECEFFLVNPEGTKISDPADIQTNPCYDQQALMRRYPVIREICDSMPELGWGTYLNQSSGLASFNDVSA